MTRVRVRLLSKTMRGYRVVTLATFPTSAAALAWLATFPRPRGGSREWIERRRHPATKHS